ncbi:MAG: DUF11 domain-containing protein [Dehalococcoidales bacterium]|nr:DUF11 domain-containing protein [Dehalococcoidales bacterium]
MRYDYLPIHPKIPYYPFLLLTGIILLGLIFFSAGGRPVSAAETLTVDTASDAGADASIDGDLAADQADGSGLSLREALHHASAGDTVTFDASLSGLSIQIGLPDNPFSLTGDIMLDGDLDNDNVPDITLDGNCFSRVMYTSGLTPAAVIEGLIVSNGSAEDGGGVFNESSSPAMTNCTFSYNSSDWGGGMLNDRSSPSLSGCTFEKNSAVYYGGGMLNSYSSPELTGCIFYDNSTTNSYSEGGGMYNEYSSAELTGCTFQKNSAVYGGGGMSNYYESSPSLSGCTFQENSAESGGGMYNDDGSSPSLSGCTFQENSADRGGGIINVDSDLIMRNCTFFGNSVVGDGGGLYSVSSSSVVTNCTFFGNSAGGDGDGIFNDDSSTQVTNCILWADSDIEIFGDCTVNYSDIDGGYPTGTGNIDQDPLLVDPSNGDFHLQPGSYCIDAGYNGAPYIPTIDFEDDPRVIDGDQDSTATADMGADEFLPPPADLEVTKTDGPDPVLAGENLTYTITVANHGPAEAVDAVLTDDLPVQLEDAQYSDDGGNNWSDWSSPHSLGTLPSGSSLEIMIRGAVGPATPKDTLITNTAGVSSATPDSDPENNSSTSQTTVDTSADLSVTKTAEETVFAGDDLTYTLTVANNGPSHATAVMVTDTVPAGTTYHSSTATTGFYSSGIWTIGDLAAGESAGLSLVVTIDQGITGSIVNTAVVIANQSDPAASDNTATAVTDARIRNVPGFSFWSISIMLALFAASLAGLAVRRQKIRR